MIRSTILDLLGAADPAATAYVAGDTSRTFAAMTTRVRCVAGNLSDTFDARSVVAILGENSGPYVELLYAIPAARMQALLLNYRHHPREWAAMLARTNAVCLMGDGALIALVVPFLNACPALRTIVVLDDADPTIGEGDSEHAGRRAFVSDETDFAQFAERVSIEGYESIATTVLRLQSLTQSDTDVLRRLGDAARNDIRVEPTDVIWLVPTSGTTGSPKLAMLTHRSVLTAAYGCHLARPVTPDDTYLYAFPLCHVAAYNVIVYHQFSRPVIVMRRFDPVAGVAAIAEHRVTSASLAPTMIAMLLDTPGLVDGSDLSSLRTIGYGSSGIPDAVLRNAMQRLGCDFSQGYGMTELSGNAAFLSASDHRIGLHHKPERLRSAGVATPLVELRVVDERGTPVRHGAVGEIAARGDQVMAGYFDDPAATAAAIVDGWLRTGDLATIDEQGYITIVDRKKDIIITGGENVASREVERVLHEHDAVREAAVIGAPDERWGELVTAVVALRPGFDADADELIGHCRARLAGYKTPRHVWFVDELPKNTTGKINKSALRQTFALRLEGGPHDLHASRSQAVGS